MWVRPTIENQRQDDDPDGRSCPTSKACSDGCGADQEAITRYMPGLQFEPPGKGAYSGIKTQLERQHQPTNRLVFLKVSSAGLKLTTNQFIAASSGLAKSRCQPSGQ